VNADQISLKVVEILNARGVPYMLVGSLSTNFHSIVRSTKDADIVVQANLAEVARSIANDFPLLRLDPQMGFESVTATRKFVLYAQQGEGFAVEIFGLSDDAHDQERFRRRMRVDWNGCPTWIATAEDVVVTKTRWAFSANRPKDLADVQTLLAVRGQNLDWPYIEQWCDEHGSRPLLEKIRADLRR
jgi:hypothetical protein